VVHDLTLTRRHFLFGAAAAAFAAPARKPNLLLILADDLGYGDMSCYGNSSIRTPHLDRLAAGGIRFTDFHASGPVCSPTRAGLMTGRYQQRCGITEVITAAGPRDNGLSPDTQLTFARRLKAAGYATGIFGKWHLDYQTKFNPDKHGFDRFRG
jgi:arylsulfatase A-like enzyme